MIVLDDWEATKRKAERLTRDRDKAAGALEQVLADLRKEYGVKSIEEAVRLEKKLTRQEAGAAREWNRLHGEFKREWGEQLDQKG